MLKLIVKSGCLLLILFSCTAYVWASAAEETTILKPKMRALPETNVLFTVKTDDIDEFLENVVIIENQDKFDRLPAIIAFESGMNIGSTNDVIFVSGLNNIDISEYSILRLHKPLIDTKTKKVYGLHAKVIGRAELLQHSDPSSLKILSQAEQIETTYKLIPRVGVDLPDIIEATRPTQQLAGKILSVEYESTGSGNNSIVIIDLGENNGVQVGNLFDVYDPVRCVEDSRCKTNVSLPLKKFAELLVYKVFDNISLALITTAEHSVDINDKIASTTRES